MRLPHPASTLKEAGVFRSGFVKDYRLAIKSLLAQFETQGLTIVDHFEPYYSEQQCYQLGLSLLGVFKLRLHDQELLYRYPFPTPRGTLILNGRDCSPTLRAVRIAGQNQGEPSSLRDGANRGASYDLKSFAIVPAEFLRVLQVTRLLTESNESDDLYRKQRHESRTLEDILAIELEAALNVTAFGHLFPIDETNPLAEVASIRKIYFPGGGYSSAASRFVSDSHRGKLCPLETPESKEIGLRLFLARDAQLKPDKAGRFEIRSPKGINFLGLSASLVPFIEHSDGARAMMGGKNLKQALPLEDPEPPLVTTGHEDQVVEESKRLVIARASGVVEHAAEGEVIVRRSKGKKDYYPLAPDRISSANTALGHRSRLSIGDIVDVGTIIADWPGTSNGKLELGKNVLVAYLPWRGLNLDDGIVVSDAVANRFVSKHAYEFSMDLLAGEAVEESSLPDPGSVVHKGSLVARKRKADGESVSLVYDKLFPGTIRSCLKSGSQILVWVDALRKLDIGDKLTGRHGNKGVATAILPVAEMPYFMVAGELRRVEVILSPVGIVSRMNLGQLLETHFGWLLHEGFFAESEVGRGFLQRDFDQLQELLRQSGLPDGKTDLYVKEGDAEISLGPTVVGYQYLSKLNHLARDKFHARPGGKRENYAQVTQQPVKGKRLGGGQRLGEMEVWALLGHGAYKILKEMLLAKSDDLMGRKILEDCLEDDSQTLLGQALLSNLRGKATNASETVLPSAYDGWPETLRVLQYYLRGMCLDLVIGNRQGKRAKSSEEADNVSLQIASAEEIIKWSNENEQGIESESARNAQVKHLADLDEDDIFGSGSGNRYEMGYIKLAAELPHPLIADEDFRFVRQEEHRWVDPVLPQNERPPRFKSISDWMEYFSESLKKARTTKAGISLVPVIPRGYRPDPEDDSHHLTKLYRELILANRNLEIAQQNLNASESDRLWKLYRLNAAVKRLFLDGKKYPTVVYSIIEHLEGRHGLLRRFLLGKRQDFSGRAVIVPDPNLQIDECGIPLDMATTLFRGPISKALRANGELDVKRFFTSAQQGDKSKRKRIRKIIERFVKDHELLVLLNRQPTLHRYNLLAFKPRIREDWVIGIPPLVCAGFNADFDGDTIALHVPLTKEGQADAKALLPTNHLFKVSNGELSLSLGQDFALGAWLLSETERGKQVLQRLFQEPDEIVGRVTQSSLRGLFASYLKRVGNSPDIVKGVKEIQVELLKASNTGYASFSFFDVQALALKDRDCEELAKAFRGRPGSLADVSMQQQQIADLTWQNLSAQNPFAGYFLSGARGNKEQLRQIAGMVGHVYVEDGTPSQDLLRGSFVSGLSRKEYWTLCHSTRRTMLDKKINVAEAGALTRDMVEGSYELSVKERDCETKDGIHLGELFPAELPAWAILGRTSVTGPPKTFRSPLTCRVKGGVCQYCYGLDLSAGILPAVGTLVGLLAGQSIGEQGTQLSMRTFHTGRLALPIKEVAQIFCFAKLVVGDGAISLDNAFVSGGPQKLFDLVMPYLLKTYENAVATIHFEVLLAAMIRREEDGDHVRGLFEIGTDWRRRGLLAAMSYRNTRRILREALAGESNFETLSSPKTKTVFAREIA